MAVEVLEAGIVLESGSKLKKIHINQHNIRSNKTKNTDLPVITIKIGSKNYYCNEIEIDGPSTVKYCGSGDQKPLISCGARVVMETKSKIKIIK
tara:strand:+ start:298 stop:579 length:282 start_codon:yes stop_codon:yes gene_type:complete